MLKHKTKSHAVEGAAKITLGEAQGAELELLLSLDIHS